MLPQKLSCEGQQLLTYHMLGSLPKGQFCSLPRSRQRPVPHRATSPSARRAGPLYAAAIEEAADGQAVAGPAGGPGLYSLEIESLTVAGEVEGQVCMPALVEVDQSHPRYTQLTVQVQDYPGLMRVMAWVMNGLEWRVQNAVLTVTPDGLARNTFWVSDMLGHKASDYYAELLAERMAEYVRYCSPKKNMLQAQEWTSANVTVDNQSHEEYTRVTIKGEPMGSNGQPTQGFLLEIASAMAGLGLTIHEGIIQGDPDMSMATWEKHSSIGVGEHDLSNGRLFSFWVCGRSAGSKLDYTQATALLYILELLMGGSQPLKPPSQDMDYISSM